jgi:quercetin dioxygenase-like cupin family protein
MENGNDTKLHFEAERSALHAERPGFRITEIQISSSQKVPWHYHTSVQDTFFVLQGCLRLFLQEPKEEICLAPGETYTVRPHRPHLVANMGTDSAVFLVLQFGDYDFVPLT